MRIAIPLFQGRLSAHFGHCQQFALVDADDETNSVRGTELLDAPPHQPGLLPAWLAEHGARLIIAGGMGRRALDLFAAQGIEVVTGAAQDTPEAIVAAYLEGRLESGGNICDH
ncbi:MAG: NifB/NifX family molybdenum-iron cluster-binding protein [Candidatus Hydrogenedentes bacterium]|nr:NifB/NifX family molybdenum-iron cluster-binding protein [Candidatus Hydrogenedentota bacterium]